MHCPEKDVLGRQPESGKCVYDGDLAATAGIGLGAALQQSLEGRPQAGLEAIELGIGDYFGRSLNGDARTSCENGVQDLPRLRRIRILDGSETAQCFFK
jgi:hypothetical protein